MNHFFIVNERVRGLRRGIELWQTIEASVYEKRIDIGEETRLLRGLLNVGDLTAAIGWLRRN
jgi:hypothetical protein